MAETSRTRANAVGWMVHDKREWVEGDDRVRFRTSYFGLATHRISSVWRT